MLRQKSAAKELELIVKEYADFTIEANAVERISLSMANRARKIGLHLQTLSGHEQITFDFWHKTCHEKLPFAFESAREFVSIARSMKEPAKDLTEAVKHIQPLLVINGNLELPERTEQQTPSRIPLMERFWTMLSTLRQPFTKLTSEKGMDDWPDKALQSMLSETEWLLKERERAEVILKKRQGRRERHS